MLLANPSLPSSITIRPTAAFWQVLAAILQFGGRESDTLAAAELCDGADVTPAFVGQTLTILTRAGILIGVRGRQGGYRLAKPLRKIAVLDVLQTVDGPVGVDEDDLPTGLTPGSTRTLRRTLSDVADDVVTRLGALTLADLK